MGYTRHWSEGGRPVPPRAVLHWWHKLTTIWTIGSWMFLAIFVIPWDLHGWTGQAIMIGEVAILVGFAAWGAKEVWANVTGRKQTMDKASRIVVVVMSAPVWLGLFLHILSWMGVIR